MKERAAVAVLPAASSTVPEIETVPSVSVVRLASESVAVHAFEETAMSVNSNGVRAVGECKVNIRAGISTGSGAGDHHPTVIFSRINIARRIPR